MFVQIKSLDYENIIFDNAINGAKLITLSVDQLQVRLKCILLYSLVLRVIAAFDKYLYFILIKCT